MKNLKKLLIFITISLTFPLLTVTSFAQEAEEAGAEVSILLVGEIPAMVVNQENTLKLQFYDNFGVNWSDLKNILGENFHILNFIYTRIWLPISRPAWKPFLGYSSVRFQADVVGNPQGWVVSVYPNTIGKSTDGTTRDLTLKAYVTDLAVDNTVTARISATRFLKDGSEYGTSYFDIPLRSQKLNWISIVPDDTIKRVSPDSMVTFDIDITNLGYFVDTFSLKTSSNSAVKALLSEQSYVLKPSETRRLTLWVYTPETFFDPGTPHTINITAYSLKFPEREFIGGVQVYTHGFYFSALSIFYIGLILLVLILILLLYYMIVGRKFRELYCKPQKPWTIPEEKRHLDELKNKDKEKYEQELSMMESEYKSAMLWYKNYINNMGRRDINNLKIIEHIKGFFKRNSKVNKSKIDKSVVKEKKKSNNKLTKILPMSKLKTKENRKNDHQLTKIIQSSEKKKSKKQVKKKRVKKPNKLDIIKPRKETKKVDKQSEKEKLIAQIKKDQEKQKSKI